MTRRLSIISLLAFAVLASGAQWDLLQVFAWGRMIADHSRSMSVTAAVKKTFDGEMCGICRLVDQAKRQDPARNSLPDTKTDGKPMLFLELPSPVVVEAPAGATRRPDPPALQAELSFAPIVPPPRLG